MRKLIHGRAGSAGCVSTLTRRLIAKNMALIRGRLGIKPSHRASVTMLSVRIASLSLIYIAFYSVFIEPYRWLAKNCVLFFNRGCVLQTHRCTDNDGDKICIFGFSRGAYTARVCVPSTVFEESYF
jgi:Uncharacterized alpha/beta hydrolase domain (DUF2235)